MLFCLPGIGKTADMNREAGELFPSLSVVFPTIPRFIKKLIFKVII